MRSVPLGPDGEELPDGHRCPDCGGPIERLHRHALDRWASVFRSVHRYRCLDAACAWEGLVGRLPLAAAAATPPVRASWRARLVWLAAGVVLTAAAVQGVRLVKHATAPPPAAKPVASAAETARMAAPGVDVEGPLLPASDARAAANTTPLTLRRHCAWGTPGADRYRGTVTQALTAARLPPEVVRTVATMAERGDLQTQVQISRDGVRTADGQRSFPPRLRAMGFGRTLCFGTRVNFPAGHVEPAALYEVRDDQGRLHTVMVPYVCGNVAVLGEEADEDEQGGGGGGGGRTVPEPAGWALVLAGLAALAWTRRGSSRRADGRRSGVASRGPR
ncbi:PEP-CTERM sorting domain-containing protein [Aquabacterium humicola]|uniref:PEP-CTERM sorting domain-containing protein n=1 Tax=Aquabacterium humicola TaxID=3237377 RepID=UPI0025437135|nr:PEP-CTERM sorting domain-containing protein [Rubrivivax pictus]